MSRLDRVSSNSMTVALAAALALGGCGEHSDADDTEPVVGRELPAQAYKKRYWAEVRRTSFGIPHVRAANERGLGYGLGYAYAEDNFCLLADAVVTVGGERSKYFGPDETYDLMGAGIQQNNLSSDFYFKYLNSPRRTKSAFDHQSEEVKDLVRGYVAGVNRYLADVGIGGLPGACRREPWVRELDELDLMRLMRRYAVAGSGIQFIDALFNAEPPALFAAAGGEAGAGDPERRSLHRPSLGARLGSNGIALGKDATRSGAGLLLANPHFPWTTSSRFYQSHLTIPGEVNVMGAGLAGFPVVNIGFNEDVAWTHTVNTSVHHTLVVLELYPTHPTSYIVDGRLKSMTRTPVIKVDALAPDGSVVPVEHAFYLTDFGPVLQWTSGIAVALDDANFDNDRLFDQWWSMAKADSLSELEESVQDILGLPWVNVLATDRAGEVYYGDITPVPRVTDALAKACIPPEFKELVTEGVFVLAGNSSACRPKTGRGAPHRGLFAASELPSLRRSDFVQNSNDSAWMTNPNAPLTGFPAIVSVEAYPQNGRTRVGLADITAQLAEADEAGGAFDMDSLQRLVLSNRSLFADVVLADLNTACGDGGRVELDDRKVDLGRACEVLARWDGTANLHSVGWPLFRAWWESMAASGIDFWEVPFDPDDPVNTPRGLRLGDKSVIAATRAALASAVRALEELGVDYEKPWGELQVSVRGDESIPIHGGDGDQIYNAIWSAPTGEGRLDVYYGTSALWAVSFEEGLPQASGFLAYSQSSNEASPHAADQTRRFSKKEWIALPFSEAAIRADENYERRVIEED